MNGIRCSLRHVHSVDNIYIVLHSAHYNIAFPYKWCGHGFVWSGKQQSNCLYWLETSEVLSDKEQTLKYDRKAKPATRDVRNSDDRVKNVYVLISLVREWKQQSTIHTRIILTETSESIWCVCYFIVNVTVLGNECLFVLSEWNTVE